MVVLVKVVVVILYDAFIHKPKSGIRLCDVEVS